MGKVKKPKSSKKNVVTKATVEEEELPVASKDHALQTVLDQLQAVNVEEKYCGLQTLALLIETPENVEDVFNQGLVKVMAPLLLDPACSVRNAAAGVLRNLSATRPETCDAMMEQDVMTPLTTFFHEHIAIWTPDPSSKTKVEDVDTVVQCINLLLNLCESSELAIKYLNQSRILDILHRLLDRATFGEEIVASVLQCMLIVVEDNPLAMEKIKNNSESQLQEMLALEGIEPSVFLIKTLASGVIINTCGGKIASLPPNVINMIISILGSTLSVDHRVICNELSSAVPLRDAAGKVEVPKGKAAQELDNHLRAVSHMIDAQQSTIEIIANICSSDDTEEMDNSGNSSDSDDNEEEDICINVQDSIFAEDKLPAQVIEAMVSLEIFDKVWGKTQLPAENVMMIMKEYEGSRFIHKKIFNLQSGALLCVNNMLSALPIENLGGANGVYKVWVEAGKLVFKQNSDNLALLESATAVMRAALDKIKFTQTETKNVNDLFNEIALSDIEIMLSGIRDCQVPEIRSNLIRMVGILALLLVNKLNETTSNVICTITEFILEQAHKENEVWVLAEAIDTIIDLYSEDETDVLAAKIKLPEKLAVLTPILKNKARHQKRLPKEYKALVSTATSNLPRFIKYKRARTSNM